MTPGTTGYGTLAIAQQFRGLIAILERPLCGEHPDRAVPASVTYLARHYCGTCALELVDRLPVLALAAITDGRRFPW